MTTLTRRQRFPFPELPEWFETFPARFAMPTMGDLYTVRIEDYMEDDRYVMRAELPGVSPEDIDVVISDGVLTVKAERTEREVDKNRSEIRYGSMSRSVPMPPGANEDDVKAGYADGMLTVSVGLRSEKAEEKHIDVKHGG
ncbi:Hsp20/alpha crystallin family protein [Streptomyces sp. NBC_01340]|uniref:Hsp20/alpha crystallin family protein n=1 Tax=unclassified Streptomyces TaxID=2593676 RepID=UPI0022541EFB|nr:MULTISPECIES: Hsp20/alpha crystallin family protein [unclassified Streptomyces]MCX4458940.1 Hsp20/alpha crystallin family protein [Streptomyces sp. NBC_01719]MCX4498297.1 Hsp20/alpha crystallin family protein [Streptomyces sp. NBC_01728]MCX4595834.1 Hsp20/alpha crystallin family protein [Streptomyces sp. NBC_01549]WSI42812.1 Hsp20/alpha crystallin family protein [Streptomyces sp. NBC_01340]